MAGDAKPPLCAFIKVKAYDRRKVEKSCLTRPTAPRGRPHFENETEGVDLEPGAAGAGHVGPGKLTIDPAQPSGSKATLLAAESAAPRRPQRLVATSTVSVKFTRSERIFIDSHNRVCIKTTRTMVVGRTHLRHDSIAPHALTDPTPDRGPSTGPSTYLITYHIMPYMALKVN
ncbi:hypothetical protein EVAR_77716_1 [Eumeta japonica]|uniref:Uncharacterized protein n=1 Tax=Eumeta variegata TaxID=151549 RepID=A0A4C1TE45_EUMVA|nr:hypothetical protein EVAR_77716_1 [Eumeta japonica]